MCSALVSDAGLMQCIINSGETAVHHQQRCRTAAGLNLQLDMSVGAGFELI